MSAENKDGNGIGVSFEFFPPATEAMEKTLWSGSDLVEQLFSRCTGPWILAHRWTPGMRPQ